MEDTEEIFEKNSKVIELVHPNLNLILYCKISWGGYSVIPVEQPKTSAGSCRRVSSMSYPRCPVLLEVEPFVHQVGLGDTICLICCRGSFWCDVTSACMLMRVLHLPGKGLPHNNMEWVFCHNSE